MNKLNKPGLIAQFAVVSTFKVAKKGLQFIVITSRSQLKVKVWNVDLEINKAS